MAKSDYYQVLGVAQSADADQIKQAFRNKARKLHPDVSDDPDAGKKFSELNEAYEVLSDPEKRSKYDRLGHEQFVSGRPEGYASAQDVDFADLGSIIDAMFGGSRGGGPGSGGGRGFGGFGSGFGGRAHARPRPSVRGQDIRVSLKVTLQEVHDGATKLITVPIDGSMKSIEVKIPKGIAPGGKLRLGGLGMSSPQPGGKPGDLFVMIQIEPDARFERLENGLDLSVDLPLSIAEATLGDKIEVPTIDNKIVTLTIPPATASDAKFRIPGHGLASADGKQGDLYVKVRIVPPSGAQISDALREALMEMKSDQSDTDQSSASAKEPSSPE
jgi:curved DNA-binding protein